jgi:hypothetical protein
MPIAPKPKPIMIKTKTNRMVNSKFVKKESPKGVVSLKKAQGENTNRAVKENLRKLDKTKIDIRLKLTEKSNNQKRALLERGIDARQLRAKGINVRETLRIFGLEDTTRAYGTKRIVSEFRDLRNTVAMFGPEEVARSFGGIKRIVGEFGLKEAYRAFGMTTIDKAYGGRSNIIKILGAEEVIRAKQSAFAGIEHYDALADIREYRENNVVVETARQFGIKTTGRALGLSTGDMKELASRLKKK